MPSGPKIRIMSVGVRPPEARAFEDFLQAQSDIAIVGNCSEMQKLASVAWKCVPHLMLLYLRKTQLAINAIRAILKELPDARVLVIVAECPTEQAVEIIEAGACGVITFSELPKQGLRAIRSVRAGEIWGSRDALSRIVRTTISHHSRQITLSSAMRELTGREGEIVKWLQTGSSNKEIAAKLFISDKTVKTHLQNIFTKLNINRRSKIFPKLFS